MYIWCAGIPAYSVQRVKNEPNHGRHQFCVIERNDDLQKFSVIVYENACLMYFSLHNFIL